MAESASGELASPQKPRFSWPMRFLLTFLIFDIVFHSFAYLTEYKDWLEAKRLERFPTRLPTLEEIGKLKPGTVTDRFLETFDSVWDYLKPWPAKETRAQLETWQDQGIYVLSWLATRVDFFERLVGFPQGWTMFSPDVSTSATVGRTRLLFEDGSQQVVRVTADPEDLTHYSHWFQEKTIDYELPITRDYDSRIGYCNYLKHRFKHNAKGSPLAHIYIYKVRYRYPEPDEDAVAVLRSQNGPPGWDREGPNYSYDVCKNKMRKLEDKQVRKEIQQQLDSKK